MAAESNSIDMVDVHGRVIRASRSDLLEYGTVPYKDTGRVMLHVVKGTVKGSGSDQRTKLHHAKSKKLIESLSPCTLENIGSLTWLKKVNALTVIINLRHDHDVREDMDLLAHLVREDQLTVLVHDMILVTLWRDEILPKLIELNEADVAVGKLARSAKTTIKTVFFQIHYCLKLITAATKYPEVLLILSRGSDLHDLIDYAVRELRYFITNKPERDPSLQSATYLQFLQPGVDAATPPYEQLCEDSMRIVAFLFNLLDDAIIDRMPSHVLTKLIHPDTRLIITLADLILTRPWCYSKGEHGGVIRFWRTNRDHHLRSKAGVKEKIRLDQMEAGTWILLHLIFVALADKFPLAPQMTQECYDKLLLLRGPAARKKLANKMPEVLQTKQFLDKLASKPYTPPEPGTWAPAPPLPYYESIRAELETKKEAILRIHSAMGTFEEETYRDVCKRFNRDSSCLSSLFDMNNCCFNCAKIDAELRCSRCQYAYYCDRKCQSKDWAKHKLICSPE